MFGEASNHVNESDMLTTEIAEAVVVCPSPNLHVAPTLTDVGSLFLKQKSPRLFRSAMNELSDVQKYTGEKSHSSNTVPWWLQSQYSSCTAFTAFVDGLQQGSKWCFLHSFSVPTLQKMLLLTSLLGSGTKRVKC